MDKRAWKGSIFVILIIVTVAIGTTVILDFVFPTTILFPIHRSSVKPLDTLLVEPDGLARVVTIEVLYHAMRAGFAGTDEADSILLGLIRRLEGQVDSMVVQTRMDRLEMEQRILLKAREGATDGKGGGKDAK